MSMTLWEAKNIMGRRIIGPEELHAIGANLGIAPPSGVPPLIPWSRDELKKRSRDSLLILGVPYGKNGKKLTLITLRSHFGCDPKKKEPCFYHQDWYLNEKFARETVLEPRWYILRTSVEESSRGKSPDDIVVSLRERDNLPPAVLTAFAFFAHYFLTKGELLWKNDFVWCADTDSNDDRIYTGRYCDPQGVNKDGFNIHRQLSIRSCYGVAPMQI